MQKGMVRLGRGAGEGATIEGGEGAGSTVGKEIPGTGPVVDVREGRDSGPVAKGQGPENPCGNR